jgi:ribosomal protein S12 methylthiotransferase
MAHQAEISAARLQLRVGRIEQVIIDEVVAEGAVARSKADAPEIDGQVYIDGATHLKVGDLVNVEIEEVDDYDMWGRLLN